MLVLWMLVYVIFIYAGTGSRIYDKPETHKFESGTIYVIII